MPNIDNSILSQASATSIARLERAGMTGTPEYQAAIDYFKKVTQVQGCRARKYVLPDGKHTYFWATACVRWQEVASCE